MPFKVSNMDFNLSPYTGMTRDSWIEAGKYLLGEAFKNIKHFEDPVVLPRYEDKITYPNSETPDFKVQAEYFEGLTRTFFIAAPLIKNDQELKLNNYCIRDYYKSQVLRCIDENDPNFVRSYSDMQREYGGDGAFNCYQQTVETCALVICLDICHEQIWDTYSKDEQDKIALFLADYAKGNTVPQNWRLFNMLDFAFLYKYGYEKLVDRDIMRDHAQTILGYYAGDGWYRDGQCFDYYSCWAFNVYAPIWNNWYGYENEPYIAERIDEHSNELMKTYSRQFDKDGFTNMWGRSNIYRMAAVSAFDGNFMTRNPSVDPGLARRISSGSLLQFFTRDDFLYKGVPSLGFYKPFMPLVQGYSCAESPYWLGKAFLCLNLPADHPFWTAKENNGIWDEMSNGQSLVTTLDGPGLCITDHMDNGETELRTGKVVRNTGDEHGMWNYAKLIYNTKYPWESKHADEVESQQYVLHEIPSGIIKKCNVTFWHGEEEDVLYRRQFFDYTIKDETHWMTAMNLADFAVPYGIIRADKIRMYQRPLRLTLGSYGFPDNGTTVIHRTNGDAKAIILKGYDHMGVKKQMAMTIMGGWSDLKLSRSSGTNPDSDESVVIYAENSWEKQYDYGSYFLISQVLTRESHDDFTDDELFSIKEISYTDSQQMGGYGPVVITMKDEIRHVIDFDKIEGRLTL